MFIGLDDLEKPRRSLPGPGLAGGTKKYYGQWNSWLTSIAKEAP